MSPPPTCSLRDTLAFLRDPAVFTGGRGLEYGDFFRLRIPGHRIHVVTDPSLAERILVKDSDAFGKSRLYWSDLRRIIGDSMGSMDGAPWEYLHRVQRPYFTPRAVEGYLPTVSRLAERDLRGLEERRGPQTVMDLLVRLNARMILSSLFGRRGGDEAVGGVDPGVVGERIADGHRIIAWTSKFPWRGLMARLNGKSRRAKEHQEFFDGLVETLTSQPHASDPDLLLGALMRLAEDPDAPPYTDSVVRNEVVFHLGAGTETLATAEGWALYLLWKHPRVLEQIREEVVRAVGEDLLSADDLPLLTYMKQVVQEVLRLYPPVYGILRDAESTVELGEYRADPGDTFLISVIGLHRNPRLWHDPARFRPDRFEPGQAEDIGRYQYLPFGAGKHVCIGRHLALPAMVLTLGQIAQRFDWTFTEDDVRYEARPSLKPREPFEASFTPRR